MTLIRRAAGAAILALALMPFPATAESQSSDSSSNCSDDRCTRVERYLVEDGRGRRGWVRREAWNERGSSSARPWERRAGPLRPPPDWRLRHPGRDDDDDDDDD